MIVMVKNEDNSIVREFNNVIEWQIDYVVCMQNNKKFKMYADIDCHFEEQQEI